MCSSTLSRIRTLLTLSLVLLVLGLMTPKVSGVRTPLEAFRPSPQLFSKTKADRFPATQHRRMHRPVRSGLKILYHVGNSEEELPVCRAKEVCSKVDLYDHNLPWLERKCRCPGHRVCPNTISDDDNHTIADKTSLYKTCEPIKKFPKCRYFKDAAWTVYLNPEANATQQIVNCQCPNNGATYLENTQAFLTPSGKQAYKFTFMCSPESRLRCARKEPCRLITMRKRHEHVDEVTTTVSCQCPGKYHCPRRHTDVGVLLAMTYVDDDIRVYNSHCMPLDTGTAAPFTSDDQTRIIVTMEPGSYDETRQVTSKSRSSSSK